MLPIYHTLRFTQHNSLPEALECAGCDKDELEKLHDDSRVLNKIDVKVNVVERAINNIGRDAVSQISTAKSKLDKFLKADY